METKILYIWAGVSIIKLLFANAYHSTDFEVHRNWMAITYSQPLSSWYFEKTSEWTLDYPPFFAYFEYLLALPASLIDSGMVKVENLDYASPSCVLYQRVTVVISDLLFLFAVYKFCCGSSNSLDKLNLSSTGSSYLLSAKNIDERQTGDKDGR